MVTLPEVKCWLTKIFVSCFTIVYLLSELYKVRKLDLPECWTKPVLSTKKKTNTIKLRNVIEENVYSKTAGFENSAWKYFFFSYSHLLNYFLLNDLPSLPSTFLQHFWTSSFLSLSRNFRKLDSVGTESNIYCTQQNPAEGLTRF